jgi:uncharacterized protein YutE (UPF0331/DUF86 family)
VTPERVSRRIIDDRLATVAGLLARLRQLPLGSLAEFTADIHTSAAAESYLRRSLEALFDIGRHIVARRSAVGVTEYREIARRLADEQVLKSGERDLLAAMAGYRNRLVHMYHEVSAEELYRICTTELRDVERIADAYRRWMRAQPEAIDDTL